jgi:predicted transposase YdaD
MLDTYKKTDHKMAARLTVDIKASRQKENTLDRKPDRNIREKRQRKDRQEGSQNGRLRERQEGRKEGGYWRQEKDTAISKVDRQDYRQVKATRQEGRKILGEGAKTILPVEALPTEQVESCGWCPNDELGSMGLLPGSLI